MKESIRLLAVAELKRMKVVTTALLLPYFCLTTATTTIGTRDHVRGRLQCRGRRDLFEATLRAPRHEHRPGGFGLRLGSALGLEVGLIIGLRFVP
jgi:hypothetical protein